MLSLLLLLLGPPITDKHWQASRLVMVGIFFSKSELAFLGAQKTVMKFWGALNRNIWKNSVTV